MYCSKCGKRIDDHDAYCKYCGAKLANDKKTGNGTLAKKSVDDVIRNSVWGNITRVKGCLLRIFLYACWLVFICVLEDFGIIHAISDGIGEAPCNILLTALIGLPGAYVALYVGITFVRWLKNQAS